MIKIKNLKEEQPKQYWDIRINRSSIFGNPFKIGQDGTRDEVVELYRAYFKSSIEKSAIFEAEVNRLIKMYKRFGQLNLFCWCAPRSCHGEIIKNWIENSLNDHIVVYNDEWNWGRI